MNGGDYRCTLVSLIVRILSRWNAKGVTLKGLRVMRRLGFFLVVAVVTAAAMIALVAASALAQSLTGLDANLTGKAEVLGAGDSPGDKDGSGTAYVTLIPSQSR